MDLRRELETGNIHDVGCAVAGVIEQSLLRDYFAAQSLIVIAHEDLSVATAAKWAGMTEEQYRNAGFPYHIAVAKSAYRMADAMLAERAK